ncbi:unnamed protein product [Haemonchus placei]|uniref:Acetyl-CoA hydrolase n=1 Tax=Haemonchus placei TaxID=6290 RepID=A0A0N4WZZ7_HAEPC|nr:unnamed protein product [Haemonchus placei]
MQLSIYMKRAFYPLASRLSSPVQGKLPKRVTADEAVSTIASGDHIFVHGPASTPTELLEALCRRVDSHGIKDLRPIHIILGGKVPWTDEKYFGKVRSNGLFLCGNVRKLVKQGQADYTPVFLSDMPTYFYNKTFPVDVALISEEIKIGKLIAENLVENGATLQLGIGAIPDSTLVAMKNHKDLGIHTELLGGGVMDLVRTGVINNTKKSVMPGKIVTTFAFGTQKFYRFLDNNPMLHFDCCSWTNHSDIIRANSKMTCINSGIEIDITGQVASDSIGSTFYSGFGGQTDFMGASSTSYDGMGKAIMAISSRTAKGQSKIVTTLSEGAGVVTTRGHTRYVVTEYGIAYLGGKTVRQRAYELIKIAHPDDRERLEREAFERLNDIYVHPHASTPTELLDALCRHVKRNNLSRIRPAHIILQGRIPWTDSEYWGKIRSNCLFICGNLRPLVNQDSRGFSSMGVDIDCSRTATSSAKKIIGTVNWSALPRVLNRISAIVNPSMPRTYGDTVIHISHIDSLVEVKDRKIYAKPDRGKPNEVEQAIGKLIAENLVEDEATLQLGIGAIPDSTLAAMRNHKNLGIHTEAVSDGVLELIDAGVITNVKKSVMPGKIVTSYGYGSRKFYDVINDNPLFHFESCEWTNRPEVIRSNSKMTCINACIEIDLTGQISSDSIGRFGGQVDFISSASTTYDGKGKAIITLPSRTSKGKSKIVGTLSQGSGVVTTRGHVRFVVTEYGIADLGGKNVRQRAYELIKIAHPDDRQMLEKQAFERLKCMPSLD